MPDVFVNYRTGDGEEAASLLERYLADRFGKERIFRAARSITPGDPFDASLLDAVRNSQVLLAIIGPAWASHPGLREDDDWVRREILQACASRVRIIPVLKGRKADRLDAADLPPELGFLGKAQSLVLDTRDNEADLGRIGDKLAELVPGLRSADRMSAGDPDAGSVRNTAEKTKGTTVQVGHDVGGDVISTSVDTVQGSLNVGGTQNNHWYAAPLADAKGRTSRKQIAEDLRELREWYFVPPPGFENALGKLRLKHTVYVQGQAGAGRITAAKMLLKEFDPGAETIHELLLQGREAGAPLFPDHIGDGELVWVDLTDTSTWPWEAIRKELPGLRHAVRDRSARLVAVLPDEAQRFEEEINQYFEPLGWPPVTEVLSRSFIQTGIRPTGNLHSLKFVTEARPLRDARKYVGLVADARARDPEKDFGAWCATAYQWLVSGRGDEASDLVAKLTAGPQRALLLSAAMLPMAHADAIEEGAASLLALAGQPPDDRPVLERLPLRQRLEEIGAERDSAGRVTFTVAGYDAAVRAYFWAQLAGLREHLRDWAASMVGSGLLTAEDRDGLVRNFAEQCLTVRYQRDLLDLAARCTRREANDHQLLAAVLALQLGLRAEQTGQAFRRQIYDWSCNARISSRLAEVLVVACRDEMAVTHPGEALTRLLHLARRHPDSGAIEAVTGLVWNHRYLLRIALGRLVGAYSDTARFANARIFLAIIDDLVPFIEPGYYERRLIGEPEIREQLTIAWDMAFQSTDEGSWGPRAFYWLQFASADHDSRDVLLEILAGAAAARTGVSARLYAMTRVPGFGPAASSLLLDKITATQAMEVPGSSRPDDEPETSEGVS